MKNNQKQLVAGITKRSDFNAVKETVQTDLNDVASDLRVSSNEEEFVIITDNLDIQIDGYFEAEYFARIMEEKLSSHQLALFASLSTYGMFEAVIQKNGEFFITFDGNPAEETLGDVEDEEDPFDPMYGWAELHDSMFCIIREVLENLKDELFGEMNKLFLEAYPEKREEEILLLETEIEEIEMKVSDACDFCGVPIENGYLDYWFEGWDDKVGLACECCGNNERATKKGDTLVDLWIKSMNGNKETPKAVYDFKEHVRLWTNTSNFREIYKKHVDALQLFDLKEKLNQLKSTKENLH